jgi:hypothetical protein
MLHLSVRFRDLNGLLSEGFFVDSAGNLQPFRMIRNGDVLVIS